MKSILITGASSGIGKTTAEAFLEQGWTVGMIARRGEVLMDVAKRNKHAVALPVDVTDAAGMKAAVERFVSFTGRIDVLFNNAGTFGPSGEIDSVDLDEFDHVLKVNVRGMFIAAQLAPDTIDDAVSGQIQFTETRLHDQVRCAGLRFVKSSRR